MMRTGSDREYRRGGTVWQLGFVYIATAVVLALGIVACGGAGLALMQP